MRALLTISTPSKRTACRAAIMTDNVALSFVMLFIEEMAVVARCQLTGFREIRRLFESVFVRLRARCRNSLALS
ncbi:hypothetical protein, partial [Aminobacter sp. BE82]|uniref:hypothetical protein n=1 Tax=Aminobacter sp. BE82 TaxID=2817838 RepID=UPI003D203214